jgi:hypothetical protein
MRSATPMQMIRSRTMRFAAALAALGAVQLALPSIQSQIPPEAYAWATFVVAVVVAVLRVLTEKPLSEK